MSLIEKAKDFFYFEDSLCDRLSIWAKDRCESFISPNSRSYEHPLQHTILFNEYVDLFEKIFEGFLSAERISLKDFYRQIKIEFEESSADKSLAFASILLGATEFHNFCELMYDVKIGNDILFCPPLVMVDEVAEDKYFRDSYNKAECKYVAQGPEFKSPSSVIFENETKFGGQSDSLLSAKNFKK